jgi:Fe-S-cluster-containing dehydrogenase component
MNEDRRSFLRTAGRTTVGLGIGLPILNACTGSGHEGGPGAASGTQWGMVIDLAKCRNDDVRAACSAACNRWHNVPDIPASDDAINWIWTEPYRDVFPDQAHAHTGDTQGEAPVLVLCNHCDNPPCVWCCPTGASHIDDFGKVVLVYHDLCIGCKACLAACPYDARFIHPDGYADKCTFCIHRVKEGLDPACVAVCPTRCMEFGDLDDPNSTVSRLLRSRRHRALLPAAGTGPRIFFLT